MTVLPANISDSAGAKPLIQQVVDEHERLEKLWADQTYRGDLVDWANEFEHFELEIVKRPEEAKGFVLLPKRWIVERTFGWFGHYRRLSKDYEVLPASSEAMIYIAMTRLMIRRLAAM